MNKPNPEIDDGKLTALLRDSRPAFALPPRFHESVWRRIERAEAGKTTGDFGWLDVLVLRVLRPRLALAAVTALVLAGAFLGVRDGVQVARQDAQARYLAMVAPNALH